MKIDLRIMSRDKVMLALLFSVLLVAAWTNFALLPLLNQNRELKDEWGSIKDNLRQMEFTITSGHDLPLQLAKVQEKLATFRALLPEPMSTDEMDDFVTALLQQHGLKPQGLIITAASEKPVVAYQFAKGTAESIKGVLPTAEVRFHCEGTARQFFDMLQSIERNHKYVRVLQYSFTEELSNRTTFNPDFVDKIQGSLMIYMFRK